MDLSKLSHKPVFFEKNRVFRVYLGGKLFSGFFGDDSEDSFYPEEWICSSVHAINEGSTDPNEGLSVVRGTNVTFKELLTEEKSALLGNRTGLDVLVKALDSAIRLPVQAHPDKPFSEKYFHSKFGKAESWLVLDTRPGAAIYFGFKEGVTPEQFSKAVEESETDKDAMERLLNKIPVKPGDMYFIPALAVHAIGEGCLMLEVQEPTDFTIQPEHWCGDYHLCENEMYIGLDKETALKVFDFGFNRERVNSECRKTPKIIKEENGCKKEQLIGEDDTPCFGVNRYIIENGRTEYLGAPTVYVVTDGKGILTNGKNEYELKKGDYFFMPFSCDKEYFVKSENKLSLAACIPPKA